jgi:hypothetical protein
MLRFIVILLTVIIIEPALPFEESPSAFIYRILNQPRYTPIESHSTIYYPKPKGRMNCIYENEYCNDVSDMEGPQYIQIDIKPLEREVIVVICEGKEEQYNCSELNHNEVEFFHDY